MMMMVPVFLRSLARQAVCWIVYFSSGLVLGSGWAASLTRMQLI